MFIININHFFFSMNLFDLCLYSCICIQINKKFYYAWKSLYLNTCVLIFTVFEIKRNVLVGFWPTQERRHYARAAVLY